MSRNIFKALAAVVLMLSVGATACTDTTELPTSSITDANFFKDPSSYQAFLARIYAGLAVSGQQGPAGNGDIKGIDEGFSQYLRLYWEAQELPTDEAVIAWGDIGLPEMNTQLWASSNTFVISMYYRIAFQVGMVNEFLRQTTDDKLASRNVSPELKDLVHRFRAEARFLRALSYWHGMDLFANIPLVDESFPIGKTPPPQATRAQIYDFVVSELNAIKGDLPPAGPQNYGRATDMAASMLLANVYLNAEVYTGTAHYSDALTEASNVIAGPFTLDPVYKNMFLADNNHSPEIIFPITQDGQHTQTYGGMTFMVHAATGGSMNANDYGIDFTWGGLRLKPEAYNRYAAGDGRSGFFYTTGQTVGIANISDFSNGIAAPKFQNVTSTGAHGSNTTFVDTDFPMFRLSDAYLIYAEAVLRGGGGTRAQALTYVNAIRERAYGGATGDIADAALTLPFILDERGRELLWEGHRRTDLVRFGEFTGGTYVWAWKGNAPAGTATDSHLDIYPIPASEIAVNPNLKQNPGY